MTNKTQGRDNLLYQWYLLKLCGLTIYPAYYTKKSSISARPYHKCERSIYFRVNEKSKSIIDLYDYLLVAPAQDVISS